MSTKEKILSYIMDSPENTNPAIISSMLDGYSSAEKYTGKTTGLSEGSGNVTISYKGTVLGNLSNSGTAVLETEDTICEGDIGIEYTKPEPEELTIPIYTRLNLGTPVFFGYITGAPGYGEGINIPFPVGAANFDMIEWDNTDFPHWWAVPRETQEGDYVEIFGYVPLEFP
jgi:hypothetical protein